MDRLLFNSFVPALNDFNNPLTARQSGGAGNKLNRPSSLNIPSMSVTHRSPHDSSPDNTQMGQRSVSKTPTSPMTDPTDENNNVTSPKLGSEKLLDSPESFLHIICSSAEPESDVLKVVVELNDKGELLTESEPQANAQSPKVVRVELSKDSPLFQEIEGYVNESLSEAPYTSTIQEDARMAHSWRVIDSPTSTPAQKARAKKRLREGEPEGLPPVSSTPVKITKIEAVINPVLLNNYLNKKQEILSRNLQDPARDVKPSTRFLMDDYLAREAGEKLLLHGTSAEVSEKIIESGFRPDLAANMGTSEKPRYGALGQGTYFSDMVSKVVTYSIDPDLQDYDENSTHEHVMLLAGTLLGNPRIKGGMLAAENLRAEDYQTITPGCDSVYSEGLNISGSPLRSSTMTNEFLLKDPHSMYPGFVIHWHHNQNSTSKPNLMRQASSEANALVPWILKRMASKIISDLMRALALEITSKFLPQ